MTLSDRLQSLANAPVKPGEPDDGREYIEEARGFTGVRYRCNLCNITLEHGQKETHVKESRHKDLYKSLKEKQTVEEQLVLEKHELLSPTEEEFQGVKDIVLSCEKSLKLVSDCLAQGEDEAKKKEEEQDLESQKEASAEKESTGEPQLAAEAVPRSIKGVMRAGLLANGLLMKGEIDVHLVLLSKDKPTTTLLSKVAEILPQQLASVSEEKYDVEVQPENACIVVTAQKEPRATCRISLTSQLMRRHPFQYYNEIAPPDPADVLPRHMCEDALRELRRARWFEAKAYALPFCEIVMRVFRDLCKRVPPWTQLDLWLLKLLVQKCLSTLDSNATAATAVHRVFECIASGILLPDGPGVYDPCEREPTDLCTQLTDQLKEDITASAQHALRLMGFQQMHRVIDVSLDDLASDSKGGSKRKRSDIDTAEFTLAEKKDKPDLVKRSI